MRSAGDTGRGSTRFARDTGLTLIETLVVLAIVAVAAGSATLTLAPRHADTAAFAATQLASAIQAAGDRSLVGGEAAVLTVTTAGFALAGSAAVGPACGGDHPLPAGTVIVGVPSGGVVIASDRALPDLSVTAGGERCQVTFDGFRATSVCGA